MSNFGQIGFDFGQTAIPFRAHPIGTWLISSYTTSEYITRYATASALIAGMSDLEHHIFDEALITVMEAHADQIERMDICDTMTYRLWNNGVKFSYDHACKIVAHIAERTTQNFPGKKYKVVKDGSYIRAGLYLKNIGSLVIRMCADRTIQATYQLDEDHFFLDSYRDQHDKVFCSEEIWRSAYCASVLAEAGDKVAAVRTFKVHGKSYVNIGATYRGDEYSECKAYSVCAENDWPGDTFTYQSLLRAFDEGVMERGDSRGLRVRVNGRACVLDRYVCVYDDAPGTRQSMNTDQIQARAKDPADMMFEPA